MTRLEDLTPENRALVDDVIKGEGIKVVQASCHTEEGVMDVRNTACDALLAHRVEAKLKGSKINQVANRIHVAMPKPRDDIVRSPFIPETAKTRKKYDPNDPERRKLERDLEAEEGGPGVYNISLRSESVLEMLSWRLTLSAEGWMLADDSWKDDAIPEIMEGKNVADFIDPDIAERLEALEREEERLEAEGFYNSDDNMVSRHLNLEDLCPNSFPRPTQMMNERKQK